MGPERPIVGIESVPGQRLDSFRRLRDHDTCFYSGEPGKVPARVLWKDAPEIPVSGLLSKQPAPRHRRRRSEAGLGSTEGKNRQNTLRFTGLRTLREGAVLTDNSNCQRISALPRGHMCRSLKRCVRS